MRRVHTILLSLLLLLAGWALYRWMAHSVAEQIYRERLLEVGRQYEELRSMYNTAIHKTAITELFVEDGKLSVQIVSAAGVLEEIPTPYDPSREIHVDYVLANGRLWIRRIHDDQTPPEKALVIDPSQVEVDWDDAGDVFGLTIYRPLGPGRWVVSVTTNGALTIERKTSEPATELRPPPEIREFEQMERALNSELAEIDIVDVLRQLWGGS